MSEPSHPTQLDADGDCWFKYGTGWLREGLYPLLPWSYIERFGPFTPGPDVDLFKDDVRRFLDQ